MMKHDEPHVFHYHCNEVILNNTIPETNIDIAPENQWLEDELPFEQPNFQGLSYFQEVYIKH